MFNYLKRRYKYFKDWWEFLKILNSPFKPLKLYWYFGNIEKGVPYFLPRKWVKCNKEDCLKALEKENEILSKVGKKSIKDWTYFKKYRKAVPLKYFGINYCSLGYKTKWTDTDYRHEWNPALSIVLFSKQLYIEAQPKISDDKHYQYSYWEAWLIYEHHTDKKLSKVERLKQCMEIMPCIWIHNEDDKEIRDNHYNYTLRKKYLKYIKD